MPDTEIVIEPYSAAYHDEWNSFVRNSKNGTFLLDRDYMDYHSDRFTDCSFLFRDANGKLLAVLPANRDANRLVSHGGLTYGGFIYGPGMKTPTALKIFDCLLSHISGAGIKSVTYKAIPPIYHTQPAEEDIYALFRNDAQLVRRDVSSVIDIQKRLPVSKGRKWGLSLTRRNEIEVRESFDFDTFIRLETEVVSEKYNVVPVHSAEEIAMLAGRFPSNIRLFGAFRNDEMLAGAVIYATETVAHAQYMAANREGKELCALDAIINHLLSTAFADTRYFDFGISTERSGRYLNVGLIEYKESWGARAIVYDTYEFSL